MGMFDTVNIRCPHCDQITDVQTKSGPCNLDTFPANDVPVQVASSALGLDHCRHCGKEFLVKARTPNIELYAVEAPPLEDD